MKFLKSRWNREVVEGLAAMYDFRVRRIHEWHLRIYHFSGRKLDFFPKSMKATWVSSNKWFVIEDIELFIETFFVTMEKYSIIVSEYNIDQRLQGYDIMQKPSSNIDYYGTNGTDIFIQFKSGATYIYHDVQPQDIEEMIKSESIGQFVGARLKKYQFTKIVMKLVNSKPQ